MDFFLCFLVVGLILTFISEERETIRRSKDFCRPNEKLSSNPVERDIREPVNSRPVQRKFPGPAGLLPDRVSWFYDVSKLSVS